MTESIIEFFRSLGINGKLLIPVIAAMPVVELRGAIPFAVWVMKYGVLESLMLSLVGNWLITVPLVFFFDFLAGRLKKYEFGEKLLEKLYEKGRKRGELVRVYKSLGLFLFVAIPLPGTGAWTGALMAFLFNIRKRYSFLSILAGVTVAGIIVSLFVSLGPLYGTITGIVFIAGAPRLLLIMLRKVSR